MARVKFNATADYAYLDNFKILSNAFRKHHVDRPIPVEQLVKCKMQDNLEFLQWTKRFWDQHYPGTPAFHPHISLAYSNLLPSQVVTMTPWPVEKVKLPARLLHPLPEHPPQGAPPPSLQPPLAQEHALL